MDTNILVIGSGISGLTYAIKMAEQNPSLEITIISKNNLLESNTRYAQGGIAVVSNFKKDSFEKHLNDTYKNGHNIVNKKVASQIIEEGPSCINWLTDIGVPFTKGENDKAIDLLKLVIERNFVSSEPFNPLVAAAQVRLSRIYMSQQDYQKVLELLSDSGVLL